MSNTATRSIFSGFAVLLLLAACGGGRGSGGGGQAANVAPTANPGGPQTVSIGAPVTLNGLASVDPDGTVVSYSWTQVAGTAVTLSSSAVAQPSFTAPQVQVSTALIFRLIVVDDDGASSAPSTVTITVNPPSGSQVLLTGNIRFARVQFVLGPAHLDYANPVMQPARGVAVAAVDAASAAVLATGRTTSTGDYSLTLPAGANIVIRVTAQMVQAGAPGWNVRVQDGANGVPYSYVSAAFNSSVGMQNVDIPLGIGANGVATGARASGPFAILDTLYLAIQTVLTVSPTATLPALYVDWGSQNAGTFFTADSTGQHIELLSDLTEDTDEFDRHTIAHEFGHYLENNFSRSDSIGGNHGLGDRLDPRVAFGEGWGYAFAAIVLNDPVVLDSFVLNGTPVASGFNIEANPLTVPPPHSDGLGCWCSEATVWSLLWDLYDNAPDANDNVALGFAPIWAAFTGGERTTPAATSIFSFIEALKAVAPASAADINTLVQAQNIDAASINAFAVGETHAPTFPLDSAGTPIPNQLPVYTPIVNGTPVVVRSLDDAGNYNKVGNHRFLRYTAPTTGTVTVTVTTSNTNAGDPDFSIWRSGQEFVLSDNPPNPQRNEVASGVPVTQGVDYVLDVYDCANGCDTPQGTPGDYDLTVLIN